MIPKRRIAARPTARDRQKELTLALLKAAARKIFYEDERPFEAVSVEEIAAEAGVSRGTVYLHFPSKMEILWSVLEDDLQSYRAFYERLAHLPKVDYAAIRRWLADYRAHFDRRRKSLELFPRLIDNSKAHIIVAHHDAIIDALGRRFPAFRLADLDPAAAERRRASGHMLLFQLDEVVIYFSACDGAPPIDVGLDLLAERILAFIKAGE